MSRKANSDDFDALLRKMMTHSPLRDSYLLSLWGNYFSGPTALELETQGLTRDDFNVLFTLASVEPVTAAEICLVNGRPKNSISRAVNKLHAAGHITRRVGDADRRKVDLTLTDEGRRLCERLMDIYLRRQEDMLANLSRDERDLMNTLLLKSTRSPARWVRSF